MKRYLSGLLALVLVAIIGLTGCGSPSNGLSGNYREDTMTLVSSMREVIEMANDAPDRASLQQTVRDQMNDYASRYRRNTTVSRLQSYTTMRTALNGLAGHYSSYANRPLPQKLKDRLARELKTVELALSRDS